MSQSKKDHTWIAAAVVALLVLYGLVFLASLLAGGRLPTMVKPVEVESGDVATWASAISTFLAIVVALWVPYRQRQSDLEQKQVERRDRARVAAEIAIEEAISVARQAEKLTSTGTYPVAFRFHQVAALSSLRPLMPDLAPEYRAQINLLATKLGQVNTLFEHLDVLHEGSLKALSEMQESRIAPPIRLLGHLTTDSRLPLGDDEFSETASCGILACQLAKQLSDCDTSAPTGAGQLNEWQAQISRNLLSHRQRQQ